MLLVSSPFFSRHFEPLWSDWKRPGNSSQVTRSVRLPPHWEHMRKARRQTDGGPSLHKRSWATQSGLNDCRSRTVQLC
jgi:hypothetical protein